MSDLQLKCVYAFMRWFRQCFSFFRWATLSNVRKMQISNAVLALSLPPSLLARAWIREDEKNTKQSISKCMKFFLVYIWVYFRNVCLCVCICIWGWLLVVCRLFRLSIWICPCVRFHAPIRGLFCCYFADKIIP